VLAVLVNWAWTVMELFLGSIKIALSAWLLYIVDEVFSVGGDMVVQPSIPLTDHYDGVRDRRSAYRDLYNAILHGDHHHDVGGDPSGKHEQRRPRMQIKALERQRLENNLGKNKMETSWQKF